MADVGVRPAVADDAAEISRIQLSTWRLAFSRVVPVSVLDGLEQDSVEATWRSAITAPPSPSHRVLVAHEGGTVVGFAAAGPLDGASSPTADLATTLDLTALLVEPRWGRRGHGSRLLAATIDLARPDGFSTASSWVLDADTASQSFLRSSGWERDGLVRDLDMDGTLVREVHFHTDLRTV